MNFFLESWIWLRIVLNSMIKHTQRRAARAEVLHGDVFFENGRLPLCVFRMPFLNWGRREHSHDFYEIMVVTAGMALHHIDGRDETMAMGDVYILPPGMRHGYEVESGGGVQVVNVLFQAEMIKECPRDLCRIEGFQRLFGNAGRQRGQPHLKLPAHELAYVTHLIEQIEAEQEAMVPGWEFFCETKFRELIIYLSRRHSNIQGRIDRNVMFLAGVVSYLEQHLAEPFDFQKLVEIGKTSPSGLRRAFQEAFGCPPMTYSQKLRVCKAMQTLSDPVKSVTEVAFEVGFQDSGYFARVFKKEVGVGPREFRRRL